MNSLNKSIEEKLVIDDGDLKIEEKSYLNDLDLEVTGDDFDVEVTYYQPPCSFDEFLNNPFAWMSDFKTVSCKTGTLKLPKEIIQTYVKQKNWNFENYHFTELIALLYLHYYRDCDEWMNDNILKTEIDTILDALPHFKTIGELFTYSFMHGDLKLDDFAQVIEVDSNGAVDITDLTDE